MAYPRGKAAPNRGIPHSEETRNKISESCKKSNMGKWNIGRSHKAWNKGIPHTKEHTEKQRISIKKYYQTHSTWNKGLKNQQIAWNKGMNKQQMEEYRMSL